MLLVIQNPLVSASTHFALAKWMTKSWNARFVKSSISNRLRLLNSSTYCAQSIGKLLTTDTSVELMISMPLLGNGRIGRRHCRKQFVRFQSFRVQVSENNYGVSIVRRS